MNKCCTYTLTKNVDLYNVYFIFYKFMLNKIHLRRISTISLWKHSFKTHVSVSKPRHISSFRDLFV